jgi:hypothetical protein
MILGSLLLSLYPKTNHVILSSIGFRSPAPVEILADGKLFPMFSTIQGVTTEARGEYLLLTPFATQGPVGCEMPGTVQRSQHQPARKKVRRLPRLEQARSKSLACRFVCGQGGGGPLGDRTLPVPYQYLRQAEKSVAHLS